MSRSGGNRFQKAVKRHQDSGIRARATHRSTPDIIPPRGQNWYKLVPWSRDREKLEWMARMQGGGGGGFEALLAYLLTGRQFDERAK